MWFQAPLWSSSLSVEDPLLNGLSFKGHGVVFTSLLLGNGSRSPPLHSESFLVDVIAGNFSKIEGCVGVLGTLHNTEMGRLKVWDVCKDDAPVKVHGAFLCIVHCNILNDCHLFSGKFKLFNSFLGGGDLYTFKFQLKGCTWSTLRSLINP